MEENIMIGCVRCILALTIRYLTPLLPFTAIVGDQLDQLLATTTVVQIFSGYGCVIRLWGPLHCSGCVRIQANLWMASLSTLNKWIIL